MGPLRTSQDDHQNNSPFFQHIFTCVFFGGPLYLQCDLINTISNIHNVKH